MIHISRVQDRSTAAATSRPPATVMLTLAGQHARARIAILNTNRTKRKAGEVGVLRACTKRKPWCLAQPSQVVGGGMSKAGTMTPLT